MDVCNKVKVEIKLICMLSSIIPVHDSSFNKCIWRTHLKVSSLSIEVFWLSFDVYQECEYKLWKLPLDSSLCAVITADSKSSMSPKPCLTFTHALELCLLLTYLPTITNLFEKAPCNRQRWCYCKLIEPRFLLSHYINTQWGLMWFHQFSIPIGCTVEPRYLKLGYLEHPAISNFFSLP